jgi:hypothetical protein
MVKKSPFSDKVITLQETAQPLAGRGAHGCGMMSQRNVCAKKTPSSKRKPGAFERK